MKHLYKFCTGGRIVGQVILYGDHDETTKELLYLLLREALAHSQVSREPVSVTHEMTQVA